MKKIGIQYASKFLPKVLKLVKEIVDIIESKKS